jgi:hypothetical protein
MKKNNNIKRKYFLDKGSDNPTLLLGISKNKFLLCFLIIFIQIAYASPLIEQQEITGNITDTNGIPLPGVTVMERGTNNGTQTDFDGKYSLEVGAADAVLIYTFVGMETIERTVGQNTVIDVVMESDEESLDEVVVVGYGTQKKTKYNWSY